MRSKRINGHLKSVHLSDPSGVQQELFYFHEQSAGSCFWLPRGTISLFPVPRGTGCDTISCTGRYTVQEMFPISCHIFCVSFTVIKLETKKRLITSSQVLSSSMCCYSTCGKSTIREVSRRSSHPTCTTLSCGRLVVTGRYSRDWGKPKRSRGSLRSQMQDFVQFQLYCHENSWPWMCCKLCSTKLSFSITQRACRSSPQSLRESQVLPLALGLCTPGPGTWGSQFLDN